MCGLATWFFSGEGGSTAGFLSFFSLPPGLLGRLTLPLLLVPPTLELAFVLVTTFLSSLERGEEGRGGVAAVEVGGTEIRDEMEWYPSRMAWRY